MSSESSTAFDLRPESLAFQNHLRDGLLRGVRQRDILDPELRGEFGGLAVEGHGWTPARHAGHFAIAPADAVIPTGAQRLHRGFLGRETGRIPLEAIGLGIAIADLSRGKHALQEAL